MEIKLKHVLGAVAVLGGGGYILYRVLTPEVSTDPAIAEPTPTPTVPTGPGGIGVQQPVWNEGTAERAAQIIVAKHVEMGSPEYSGGRTVELAWTAANEIWPFWNWPTNVDQSNVFVQSDDLGVEAWDNLLAMAQDQLGYVPVT